MLTETDLQIGKILLSDVQNELELYFQRYFEAVALDPEISDSRGGRSVYFEKLKSNSYNYRICVIRFYYFKIENGKLIARHYYYSQPVGSGWTNYRHEIISPTGQHIQPSRDIADALRELLENAQKPLDQQNPQPIGDVKSIDFRERSFMAFCFDHEGWTFPLDPRLGTNPPIPSVFFTDGGSLTPNHNFFDGRTTTVGSGASARPIFYMVNHAKKSYNGADLDATDRQQVKFNIVVDVPLYPQGTDKLTVIFDPGGNNLGPPGPP
jgi:hypothetical protein